MTAALSQQITKTTTEWETENPILSKDVIGIELVNGVVARYKRGDGATAWRNLKYIDKKYFVDVPTKLSQLENDTKYITINHNHDTVYAPKSHSDNSAIHVTASEKSTWNSKAAGSHNHSASDITSGTLPVGRGGTGVTSTFTNFTFTKSHASFGSHWGQIFYVNYLGMAYLNIAISVNTTVNAGAVTIGSVNSSYKPQTRTQLAASLSRGHAFISDDGSITLYSEINFNSGSPVYISGWYRVAS